MDYIDTKHDEIGFHDENRKKSLKGYVSERKLVRFIKENKDEIEKYLLSEYHIPPEVSLKVKEEKIDREKRLKYNTKDPYETYLAIDLIESRLIAMNAEECIELLDIYEYEGVYKFIDYIQLHYPILRL